MFARLAVPAVDPHIGGSRGRGAALAHFVSSTMSRSRIARWGWLATTFALAVALLVTAWVGLRRAADARATLDRGQGEVLLEAAREAVRITPRAGLVTALDSLVARHESGGLRFVAVVEPGGDLLAQVGTPTGGPLPTASGRPGPSTLVPAGRRERLVGIAPLAREPGQRDDIGPRTRPRPSLLVLEFEPLVAESLTAQAWNTFALSAAGAITLLALALVFWRLTLRQEAAERRIEEQRRLGVLGEMSAVLAHEIRNPLASLKGHAQLLAERMPEDGAERRKADRVVQEAERLEALTTDLLDFARSGAVDVRPEDPVALLRSCIEEVDADGFTVQTEGAPRKWPLAADRMRQALTNVLRNALQASPPGIRPLVAMEKRGESLVVTVRDFGGGIAPGDEKRIFSPFYTTRTTGTGLGLAVALRGAEMHHGTIVAENDPDGGAVFRITIPGG